MMRASSLLLVVFNFTSARTPSSTPVAWYGSTLLRTRLCHQSELVDALEDDPKPVSRRTICYRWDEICTQACSRQTTKRNRRVVMWHISHIAKHGSNLDRRSGREVSRQNAGLIQSTLREMGLELEYQRSLRWVGSGPGEDD